MCAQKGQGEEGEEGLWPDGLLSHTLSLTRCPHPVLVCFYSIYVLSLFQLFPGSDEYLLSIAVNSHSLVRWCAIPVWSNSISKGALKLLINSIILFQREHKAEDEDNAKRPKLPVDLKLQVGETKKCIYEGGRQSVASKIVRPDFSVVSSTCRGDFIEWVQKRRNKYFWNEYVSDSHPWRPRRNFWERRTNFS